MLVPGRYAIAASGGLLGAKSRFPEIIENNESVLEEMERFDGALELAKQMHHQGVARNFHVPLAEKESSRLLLVRVQVWMRLKKEKWLPISPKRHQLGHVDFRQFRLLTGGLPSNVGQVLAQRLCSHNIIDKSLGSNLRTSREQNPQTTPKIGHYDSGRGKTNQLLT